MAGEQAVQRFANKEASSFFTRALQLSDPSQTAVRLRAAIGGARAGWAYNQPGTDLERLEGAVAAANGVDQQLVAEASFWIAFIRRQRGETPESSPALKASLDRTEEIGKALGDAYTAALPNALIGVFDALTGNLRQGALAMQSAIDALPKSADPLTRAMLTNFLVMAYAKLGEFSAAEQALAHVDSFAATVDGISRLDTEIAKATLEFERGDVADASGRSLACLRRAEDLGAYACAAVATTVYGAASLALDNAGAAKDPLERGRELSQVTNQAPLRTLIHGFLGEARAELGDLPGGVVDWQTAFENAHALRDRYGEAHTLWARARAYARQQSPNWMSALGDVEQAIELFEAMEAKPSLARALRDRAQALRGLGRGQEADAAEAGSAALGRQLALNDFPRA
jgi:tetratricopeptide (TPR) repeat protein